MRCFPFHYKMRCFPCFRFKKLCRRKKHLPTAQAKEIIPTTSPSTAGATSKVPSPEPTNNKVGPEVNDVPVEDGNSAAKTFTFRELATATKNFRQECLLSEGGFGRIFKGTLQPSGQVVAVRQLDRSGTLATKEFLVEVLVLSLLRHPNLVTLLGYCADGDQRLLVYEYMPLGSLDDHLFGTSTERKKLDWSARMKIASGVAEGLEYLNEKANPPIIYRDLKSSNILLDEESNPRLSHFGLDKLVQSGNKMHVTPRVMAAYGYSAPEYERRGELSLKSDVYSFGVVLLELITGRRAFDNSRPLDEQNLVTWAQPFFKDPTSFPEMVDPSLGRDFPVTSLNQAVGVAAMCLQEDPSVRPFIGDVVAALSFLMMAPPGGALPKLLSSRIPSNDDDDDCSSSSSSSSKYIEFSGRRDCSDSTGVESQDGDGSSGGCDNSKVRVRFKDENGNIYSADEIEQDLH